MSTEQRQDDNTVNKQIIILCRKKVQTMLTKSEKKLSRAKSI